MICEKKDCTGCFACFNICPKRCIQLVPDSQGHIYPEIDKKLCINCKLCEKVCPSINKLELKYPKKCFASWAKDTIERETSTSGGLASVFSKYILEIGGVVFGTVIENDLTVNHKMITNTEELNKTKGSKYVHSYINNTFIQAKEQLEAGKTVLFIGTPCQIAGLKSYLRKNYDNLYTIDLICHGVPSQKMLKEELNQYNANSFSFRDEKGYNLSLFQDDKLIKKMSMPKSPYFYSFLHNISLRENCFSCLYARPERISDITIGDFWGLKELENTKIEKDKGISVVLPITDKGLELIKKCEDKLFLEEKHVDEALKGNNQLNMPSKKSHQTDYFNELYPKFNFDIAAKKASNYYSLKNMIIRVIYSKTKLLDLLRKVKRIIKK